MRAVLVALIIFALFCMSLHSTKHFTPKVNIFASLMMVCIGGYAVINAGQLISDVYQFQELCEFLVSQSPNSNLDESGKTDVGMITLGLSEYFHCYDFGFQETVNKQIDSIATAESALFRSIVEDIKSVNKSKNLSLAVPQNIQQLQGLKSHIDSLQDDLFFSSIHLNVINELEAIKTKVIRIPQCKSMGPFFDSGRTSWCTTGLHNGLVMFYSMFALLVGCLFLMAAYFQNEIIIKFKNEQTLS